MSARPRREKYGKTCSNHCRSFDSFQSTIAKLREAAADCRACDLWKRGTQTVFGEGGSKPRIMLVGEQPGDQEDIQGRPFVGHPSSLLRAPDEETRHREERFIADLKLIHEALDKPKAA
jgi:uracil-DNA glycosylase